MMSSREMISPTRILVFITSPPYDWPSVRVDRCALVRDSTTIAILSDLCSATIVGTSRFGLPIEELVLQQAEKKGGHPFTASPFLVQRAARE